MWVWLDRVTPLLLDASLAAAVLSSVFLALLLVCSQPAKRIALARTAILGLLAILPLTAFAPWPRFHIVQPHMESTLAPRQIFVRRASSKILSDHPQQAAREAVAVMPISDEARFSAGWMKLSHLARKPIRLVALVYLGIVAIGLIWEALGYLGIWWLIRVASPPSPRTREIFESLLAEMDPPLSPRDRPGLRISERVDSPVVVALLSPTILLPAHFDVSADEPDPAVRSSAEMLLKLSLLHELAHAGRRDASFRFVGMLAQSIWFFLPQLWWIRLQKRLDQEFLADHLACRSYGTSSQYATSLLDLAASRPARSVEVEPQPLVASRGMTHRQDVVDPEMSTSSLAHRLLMLLHCPYRLEARAPRGWLWGMRFVALATTIALANVTVRIPGIAYGHSVSSDSLEGDDLLGGNDQFQVSELIISPVRKPDSGRSDSYVLPYRLPTHFSMTVEVLASRKKLAQIRLLDLPLAEESWSPADPNDHLKDHLPSSQLAADDDPDREHWHRIRNERNDHGTFLSVDQHALPCPADPANAWLSVEPALGKSVELRNLVVIPTS